MQWLEQTLRDYPGTVIIVTHDRYFLDNITKWILELESGRGLPFEGNYSSWLAQKVELLRIAEKKREPAAADAPAGAGLDSQLAPRAAANEPGPHQCLRRVWPPTRSSTPRARRSSRLRRAAAGRPGAQRPPRQQGLPLQRRLSEADGGLQLRPAADGIVGVIRPNGTGKTTLFRMITGQEQPDAGHRAGPERGAFLR